jgi:hypothetical protein
VIGSNELNTAMYVRLGRSKTAPVSEFGRYSWYRRGEFGTILHQFDGFKAEYLSLKNALVAIGKDNSIRPSVYEDDPQFQQMFKDSQSADSLFRRREGPIPEWVFAMEVGLKCDWISEPVLWNLHPFLAGLLIFGHRPLPGVAATDNLAPEYIGKMLHITTVMWSRGKNQIPYPVVNHA